MVTCIHSSSLDFHSQPPFVIMCFILVTNQFETAVGVTFLFIALTSMIISRSTIFKCHVVYIKLPQVSSDQLNYVVVA